MEQFVVSARKYRPATFNTVVGQASITGTLKNAIKNQHLAQAFLFCGPRGVGKTTCARILAKTINCTNPTSDTEGCNECESCVAFNEGQSLNIFELDGASNNGVEEMRSLVEKVRYPPQSGKYKVYIIDEVHMLSVPAFNAFLKTLEEPPPYAIFILATTEKHKIIPTILSRCQIFDFNRITIDDISIHLKFIADSEHVTAESEALHLIAQKADGALRDALSIFDQIVSYAGNTVTYKHVIENLNILDYEYYFKVTDFIHQNNYPEALLLLNELMTEGYELHHFISGLASHFRDLLICKDPKTITLLEVGGNIKEKYKAQSQQCSTALLFKYLNIASKCDFEFKLAQNQRLHTELAILKMCALAETPNTANALVHTQPAEVSKKKVAEPEVQSENISAPVKIVPSRKPDTAKTESTIKVDIEAPEKVNSADHIAVNTEIKKKSPRGRPGIISISQKLSGTAEEETDEITSPQNRGVDQPVSSEMVVSAIKEFATGLIEQGRKQLAVALNKHEPVLIDGTIIEIPVDNAILSDDIQDHKPELLSWIKQKLSNHAIEIRQRVVTETELKTVAYTPAEKFSQMAEKNPDLNKLKQQFDLDLDY